MRLIATTALAVLAAAAIGSTAAGQSETPTSTPAAPPPEFLVPSGPRRPEATARMLEVQLQQLTSARDTVRARFQAGRATQSDLAQAEAQLTQARIGLEEAMRDLADSRQAESLLKPVDVKLTDATLAQTAEALTAASGVQIKLDPEVKEKSNARITLQAQGITLGALLGAVAERTELMIAPTDGGVVLKRWPTLEFNGKKEAYKGALAPWSDEWLKNPIVAQQLQWGTAFTSQGGRPFGRFPGYGVPGAPGNPIDPAFPGTGAPVPTAPAPVPGLPGGLSAPTPAPAVPGSAPAIASPTPVPPALPPGFSTTPGYPGSEIFPSRSSTSTAGRSYSVTTVGDRMIVVAEPGRGPNGEAGAWLTLYKLEGGQLAKVGATFHHSMSPTATPRVSPALPGMGVPGAAPVPAAPRPIVPTRPRR